VKTLRLLLLALSLVSVNAAARQGVPVIDHEQVSVSRSSGQPASAEQVKKAIEAAAAVRGWQVSHKAPGKLIATLHVRGKHTVSTEFSYAAGQFSAKYRDSVNMNFQPGGDGAGLIHPHYNKWLQLLLDGIRVEASRL